MGRTFVSFNKDGRAEGRVDGFLPATPFAKTEFEMRRKSVLKEGDNLFLVDEDLLIGQLLQGTQLKYDAKANALTCGSTQRQGKQDEVIISLDLLKDDFGGREKNDPLYGQWDSSLPALREENGERRIVGIIGDEDTVTGFLLAGVGDNRVLSSSRQGGSEARKSALMPNFVVVNSSTPLLDIETAFTNMCGNPDIGIIVICQHIANDIRHLVKDYKETIPCILEIPSKGGVYDAEKDYVLEKVSRALGIR